MNAANAPEGADSAVVVHRLVKKYRNRDSPAVDNISFNVSPGEVFGLLGPNGAGKSTTVGMMTTRVAPSAGWVRILGIDVAADPAAAHRVLAVVPQVNNLDRSLTVVQNLAFHAGYFGMRKGERRRLAYRNLEWVGLGDHCEARVGELSGGQAQRVMVARALIHQPRVLFMDEPATGLDPQSRLFIHDRVAELSASGVTVVITTHDMEEAAKLCGRVGIIDHGRLLALDTPQRLTETLGGEGVLTVSLRLSSGGAHTPEALDDLVRAVERTPSVDRCEIVGAGGTQSAPTGQLSDLGRLRVHINCPTATALPAVLGVCAQMGFDIEDVSVGRPTLEDVFIELTGRELR